MPLSRNDIISLNLWQHQRDAVRLIAQYLARATPDERSAALVNIPTGGGKSAVIAVATHRRETTGKILVLTPRKSLRRQLAADLGGKRGLLLAKLATLSRLKSVNEVTTGTSLRGAIDSAEIIVLTIQLLTKVAADSPALFQTVRDRVSAVFVDEGHYEPAPGWSVVIRDLARPTVLLTATPYRNDFRDFVFDEDAIHVTRYKELQESGSLRALRVIARPATEAATPVEFVRAVLREFRSQYQEEPSDRRRLIVRCSSKDEILAVQQAFSTETNLTSVAVHERFADNPPPGLMQFRDPPDPATHLQPVWIHQYKLLEGIDVASFRAIAIYRALGSARALVQQVGRALRRQRPEDREDALLIDFSGGKHSRQWQRYLAYDAALDANRLQEGLADVAAAISATALPTLYADGEFRSQLRLSRNEALDLRESVRLPFRCCLLRTNLVDPIAEIRSLTFERLTEEESAYRAVQPDNDQELLILFVQTSTSPYVAEHFFVEQKLQVYYALREGDVVAILDTSRNAPTESIVQQVGKPIRRSDLAKALQLAGDLQFTEVTSRNTVLGGNVVRGKTITGVSLAEMAPLLDDLQFAPSSVVTTDRSQRGTRAFSFRSLGFGNARVSDYRPLGELKEWRKWARSLIVATQSTARQSVYFRRFAQPLRAGPTCLNSFTRFVRWNLCGGLSGHG